MISPDLHKLCAELAEDLSYLLKAVTETDFFDTEYAKCLAKCSETLRNARETLACTAPPGQLATLCIEGFNLFGSATDHNDLGIKVSQWGELVSSALRGDKPDGGNEYRWYYLDPEDGIELFLTPESAKETANVGLDAYKDCANSDGWHEDMERLQWGRLVPFESVAITSRRKPDPELGDSTDFDEYVDYELLPTYDARARVPMNAMLAG
jgi:hypothetical protein